MQLEIWQGWDLLAVQTIGDPEQAEKKIAEHKPEPAYLWRKGWKAAPFRGGGGAGFTWNWNSAPSFPTITLRTLKD